MVKIGITGGIGSGKTTICNIFEVLGVPVFYADTVAKEIMIKDAVLMEGIRTAFGTESYFENGNLNNKHLAAIVFNDKKALKQLNELVHPAVFRAFDHWTAGIAADVPYILKEAALLFESGSYKMCDASILVTAPLELKINRVMRRDQVTAEQIMARMEKQFTDEQKIKMAGYFIINDEEHPVIDQVLTLHRQFLALSLRS